jgi:hypothetical protein
MKKIILNIKTKIRNIVELGNVLTLGVMIHHVWKIKKYYNKEYKGFYQIHDDFRLRRRITQVRVKLTGRQYHYRIVEIFSFCIVYNSILVQLMIILT